MKLPIANTRFSGNLILYFLAFIMDFTKPTLSINHYGQNVQGPPVQLQPINTQVEELNYLSKLSTFKHSTELDSTNTNPRTLPRFPAQQSANMENPDIYENEVISIATNKFVELMAKKISGHLFSNPQHEVNGRNVNVNKLYSKSLARLRNIVGPRNNGIDPDGCMDIRCPPTGSRGPYGQKGFYGPKGFIGLQGNHGRKGDQGLLKGVMGQDGHDGRLGKAGDVGDPGSDNRGTANTESGAQGVGGDTGPPGSSLKGFSGGQGASGDQGGSAACDIPLDYSDTVPIYK